MAKMTVADVHAENGNGNGVEKITRVGSGNIYMKKPTPEMLDNQYIDPQTGEPDERYNKDFVLEKIKREYIDTLKFQDEKTFLKIMSEAWQWHLLESKRQKDRLVEATIEEFKNDKDYLEALIARSQQLLKTTK